MVFRQREAQLQPRLKMEGEMSPSSVAPLRVFGDVDDLVKIAMGVADVMAKYPYAQKGAAGREEEVKGLFQPDSCGWRISSPINLGGGRGWRAGEKPCLIISFTNEAESDSSIRKEAVREVTRLVSELKQA